MSERKIIFEVCCGSAYDAEQAYLGGASQIELNSDLFHGGLTPTIGMLLEAKKRAPIPTMCMVRPREGGFCYTECEYAVMLQDAKLLLQYGADGIVFGFLNSDGTVDMERCKEMLGCIGAKQSVFHRAIDVVPDVFEALDRLIELGITRVLTSGQAPTVPEGIETLKKMIAHANGRIEILPGGGGVYPSNASWCMDVLGVEALHVMAQKSKYDLSTSGNPSIHFGGALYPSNEQYFVTDRDQIADIVSAISR